MSKSLSLLLVLYVLGSAYCDCPLGFTRNLDFCYHVLPVQVSWPEALRLCEAFKAKLAWIDSDAEFQFIAGMLDRMKGSIRSSEVWLAGTDMLNEGTWIWADSMAPFAYSKFAPGEPNNDHGQHCAAMEKGNKFLWDDATCETKLEPLCKAAFATTGEEVIG